MLSQLRTVGAGIAVLALCFTLASLSWQYLLLGFATASIAWAIWSWSAQLSAPSEKTSSPVPFERRRRVRRENLYDFPAQDWGSQSTGY
jgi:hypothetical protein